MSATERLYYHDSRLLEFDAVVVSVSEHDDRQIAIELDRTAFYPTGGGQPNDTGMLGEARVVDCIEVETEGILHLIVGSVPEIGDRVHGRIDWLRRLDHLQQHTGQHILSAAFIKLFDAPTHSFRVLEHECEIDVALDDPTNKRIEQAVDLANQVIWENRPMTIRQVTAEQAATLPLRKEPPREGELRVIEIDDFDLTPCGGTHAKSTGEVGVIAVRSWERAKGLTRIQFMAGMRAVADYRKANRIARDVAALFSAGREDSPALVARLVEESKKLRRRVSELEEVACRVEAEELLKQASDGDRGSSPTVSEGSVRASSPTVRGGAESASGSDRVNNSTVEEPGKSPRIIAKLFNDRDADSLKRLALALIAHSHTVALLGSRDGETARLVFARSPDADGDMRELMNRVCPIVGGRGGGKPDMAQGGGKKFENLAEAIDLASKAVR